MRKLIVLVCILLFFFSCTIEKRRYFDGYHISRSISSGTARSTGSGEPHSTSSGTARSTGSGTAHSTGSVNWEEVRAPQRVDVVTAEKESDSQNLIVFFDDCLISPEVELAIANLDKIAPRAPARVSERLDSLNTGVNWPQIIQEQRSKAEYNFLFMKLKNAKRNPLRKFDILKNFLTGISALLLGGLLIGLSGNNGSFFKGLLPFGIVLAIIGLVMIIVSAIRVGRADTGDPRIKTQKKSVGLFHRRF